MERVADRIESSPAPAVPETPGHWPAGAPGQKPVSRPVRQFDDIPTVVRALLTGYDEA